ncbi:MAG: sigma factor [Calditrichia bacterium]
MKIRKYDQTESEWVEKIRDSDAQAFEHLFKAYCQPLINFARRFVRDVQIAENIVQDVFLKIWTNRISSQESGIKLFAAYKNGEGQCGRFAIDCHPGKDTGKWVERKRACRIDPASHQRAPEKMPDHFFNEQI